jgi:hypothetical protein
MSILLRLTVPNPDDILTGYGAGALIRIERAATEAGAYAEVDTEAVVATSFLYEVWDAAGLDTSWYRTRYSNALNTAQSEYGDSFSPGTPTAYATIDQLLVRLPQQPPSTSTARLARMQNALLEATDRLTEELGGVSFFRSPASGADEVRLFEVGIDGVVHVHEGVISIAACRIRRTRTGDFEDVDIDDLQLEYWAKRGQRSTTKPAGEPYDHVSLTGRGTLLTWPATYLGIEFTGAWQWPAIPTRAVDATCDWARQALAADPTFVGGIVGPEELGRPIGPNRVPDSVWRLQVQMSRRFWCAL